MKDTMIGVDLAKSVFQLHGASMTGQLRFRKKLSRPQRDRGDGSLWRRELLGSGTGGARP